MYGRGTPAIAEQLGRSVEETQRITDLFFDTFPAIKKFIEHCIKTAKEKGYVMTAWGRKRRLPELSLPEFEYVDAKTNEPITDKAVISYYHTRLKNAWGKEKNEIRQDALAKGIKIIDNGAKINDAKRQAVNSVIQGTSADITKKAMLELGRSEELKKLGFRMLLTVHDEIIGEAPRENALKCGEIMAQLMIQAPTDRVKVGMKVDCEWTDRWYGDDIKDELIKESA